jgi:hypothetical protein
MLEIIAASAFSYLNLNDATLFGALDAYSEQVTTSVVALMVDCRGASTCIRVLSRDHLNSFVTFPLAVPNLTTICCVVATLGKFFTLSMNFFPPRDEPEGVLPRLVMRGLDMSLTAMVDGVASRTAAHALWKKFKLYSPGDSTGDLSFTVVYHTPDRSKRRGFSYGTTLTGLLLTPPAWKRATNCDLEDTGGKFATVTMSLVPPVEGTSALLILINCRCGGEIKVMDISNVRSAIDSCPGSFELAGTAGVMN